MVGLSSTGFLMLCDVLTIFKGLVALGARLSGLLFVHRSNVRHQIFLVLVRLVAGVTKEYGYGTGRDLKNRGRCCTVSIS